MKNHRFLFLVFTLATAVLLFSSCEPKWKESDLHGAWEMYSWTEASTGKVLGDKMDFTFDKGDDKRYMIDYGSMQEKGKYWIEYDFLITVEDGSVAKKVKIIDIATDTLTFDMNRAGRLERLVLTRVQ